MADLTQVFPLINSAVDGASAPVTHERYRGHRAVRLLLERLATNRPLVLVLDDVHWADSARSSCYSLSCAGRRLRQS